MSSQWQVDFIEALRETGHVGKSCVIAKVSRQTVYVTRHADESFASRWDSALSDAAWTLEDEGWRRARDGVDEPIIWQGEVIGTQKKYSDTLLMFLLKGIRPDKFGDKLTVKLSPEDAALLKKYNLTAGQVMEEFLQNLARADSEATQGNIQS